MHNKYIHCHFNTSSRHPHKIQERKELQNVEKGRDFEWGHSQNKQLATTAQKYQPSIHIT